MINYVRAKGEIPNLTANRWKSWWKSSKSMSTL